jgi:hypothetical protein
VSAEGKPTHAEIAVKYDGKDYPVTGTGLTLNITIALKRIDADTHEMTLKQGGKVMSTGREVVSKDGKAQTRTTKGKNAQGQDINNAAVYGKQ